MTRLPLKTRQYTEAFLEMVQDGILDKDLVILACLKYMSDDLVILACLKYMSDDEVRDMAEANGFFPEEEG